MLITIEPVTMTLRKSGEEPTEISCHLSPGDLRAIHALKSTDNLRLIIDNNRNEDKKCELIFCPQDTFVLQFLCKGGGRYLGKTSTLQGLTKNTLKTLTEMEECFTTVFSGLARSILLSYAQEPRNHESEVNFHLPNETFSLLQREDFSYTKDGINVRMSIEELDRLCSRSIFQDYQDATLLLKEG